MDADHFFKKIIINKTDVQVCNVVCCGFNSVDLYYTLK